MDFFIWSILGAVLASFACAVAIRYEKGQSLFIPSACDQCGEPLKMWAMIPIFSWGYMGGKSKCCSQKIPLRYMVSELFLALAFAIFYGFYGWGFELILMCLLSTVLLGLSLVDLSLKKLPDRGVLMVAILALFQPQIHWKTALFSGGVALGLHWFFRTKNGLGLGDVKLMAASGLWLPFDVLPLYFILTGFFGILTSLVLKERRFPFGPSLALALVLVLLVISI